MPDLEYLKVLEDSVGQLDPVFRFLAVAQLGLHLRSECFHHRVVVTTANGPE